MILLNLEYLGEKQIEASNLLSYKLILLELRKLCAFWK